MNSYQTDVSELRAHFKSIAIPEGPIRLNCCSVINNIPIFLNSHFSVLKANDNNATFEAFLIRLKELKEVLNK